MYKMLNQSLIREKTLVFLILPLLLAVAFSYNPLAASILTVGILGAATLLYLGPRFISLSLGFIGVCLLGYTLLGRSFAYFGFAPLYVGEMALLLGLVSLILFGRLGLIAKSVIPYLLLIYMGIGLLNTLPYVSTYKFDAFRDAALWAYGLFAIIVATLVVQKNWVMKVMAAYGRCVPIVLLCLPPIVILGNIFSASLPRLGGPDVRLFELKGGDIAVHLAGLAAFVLLGLHVRFSPKRPLLGREWVWWLLWFTAAALPLFRARAGILAVVAAVFIVVALRPGSRWGKPLALVFLAFTALGVSNFELTWGKDSRNVISTDSLVANVTSIFENTGDNRSDTKKWRLMWWHDIVNYTLHGKYFWMGKGYGINLADADGYQVNSDASLRSPHNGHLSVLARSGVPGLVAWAVLQLVFAVSLLRAHFVARAAGARLWADLNLWVLAYWAAFMVNSSFDVYLEGPVGGIWFWCLFGFGLALLIVQRRRPWTAKAQSAPSQLQSALE